jgi:glycosyltransferase involved in cell wall biosynthesis
VGQEFSLKILSPAVLLGETIMDNGRDKTHVVTKELKLAYIIGAYPLLTTTFIDREINLLRKWGVNLRVVSIRRPRQLSPEQKALQQDVTYLLPVSKLSFIGGHLRFALLRPLVYFGTLFYLLTRPHPHIKSRFMTFLHFAEGGYAAHILHRYPCDQIHVHFVDRAATVGLVVSRLLNVPYSVTAHANDIYVNPILLPEKLSESKFIATCTGYNKAHLSCLREGEFNYKLRCIYHGLDVHTYQPESFTPQGTPILLAVGQLKEKKGFAYLLKACRMLKDRGYEFECQIVGEGPLRETLEAQLRQLSLEDTVSLCGALPHQEVIDKYKRATIFVLPCVVADDGGRDGIPNVILEAMAMQLPVVSTRHSGIPEVVEDGVNGLLVPPADEVALSEALATLLDDPNSRQQFGQKGRQTIIELFSIEKNVKRLLAEFGAHLPP